MDTQQQPKPEFANQTDAINAAMGVFWQHTDQPERYPLTTGEVVDLLARNGFRVDGDFVLHVLNTNQLTVPMVNGHREWGPRDIWALGVILEYRRRWKLHPLHVHKLSAIEHAQLVAEEEGRETVFTDLDAFDAETLIALLEESPDANFRRAVRTALTVKLREAGAL